MTRSITATLPRNHDRDESICSSIQWPPNFTNVSDDFFKVHAATMCAHWCQLDTNVPRPLPACVLPLLEDELRKLKTLISSSSEIIDLVKTNAAKRRLFWPMFFGRYPISFALLGIFGCSNNSWDVPVLLSNSLFPSFIILLVILCASILPTNGWSILLWLMRTGLWSRTLIPVRSSTCG